MPGKYPRSILYFSLIWLLLNLIQSLFTNVIGDEAYYYYYSKDLSWGYFDHPPAVAWIIKISNFFFSGNLSIRLVTTLISSATILLIWQLIPEKNRNQPHSTTIFILLFGAFPLFHAYGFVTTPDAPLLFFACLYLLAFQKFAKENTLWGTLYLGVTSALLIYAKYHGGLLILATVGINPRLLKNYRLYLAGGLAAILLAPHFLWLTEHQFIPLTYHLIYRMDVSYGFKGTLESILGCIGAINPILLVLIIVATVKFFKSPGKDPEFTFHLRLFWVLFVFFILYTFRSKVEAHWVAMTMIPLIPVLHAYFLNGSETLWKRGKTLLLISITLLATTRILLALPLKIRTEFHQYYKPYYSDIKQLAGNRKVAFVNKYTQASLYSFYTGDSAFTYTDAFYRKNQYDISDQNKNIYWDSTFVVGNWGAPIYTEYKSSTGQSIFGLKMDRFKSYGMLRGTVEIPPTAIWKVPNRVSLQLYNPNQNKKLFTDSDPGIQIQLILMTKQNRYFIPVEISEVVPGISEDYSTLKLKYTVTDVPAGVYDAQFAVKHQILNPQSLTEEYPVEVFEK